jgi:hypothetical protein
MRNTAMGLTKPTSCAKSVRAAKPVAARVNDNSSGRSRRKKTMKKSNKKRPVGALKPVPKKKNPKAARRIGRPPGSKNKPKTIIFTGEDATWTSVDAMPRISDDLQVPPAPLQVQVGGSHYKDMAIQPIEYITKNNLGFCEGNVVKYISRHAAKNGAEDIRKVIHYCQLLLQLEYGVSK